MVYGKIFKKKQFDIKKTLFEKYYLNRKNIEFSNTGLV